MARRHLTGSSSSQTTSGLRYVSSVFVYMSELQYVRTGTSKLTSLFRAGPSTAEERTSRSSKEKIEAEFSNSEEVIGDHGNTCLVRTLERAFCSIFGAIIGEKSIIWR
jgi:hypothetical protein